MKVVIDIPENVIEGAKSSPNYYPTYHFEKIWRAIANGTPLPKGHGRLIDASKFANDLNRAWTLWEKKGEDCYLFSDVLTPMLVSQKSVIEADKEKENGLGVQEHK